MNLSLGDWMIAAGIILIIIGLAYKFGLLSWFGNLPGDIRYESGNTRFYFPIVTMIIVSIVLSLIVSFFRK